MRERTGLFVPLVEEQYRVAFEDMLNAVVVVRLVDGDNVRDDTVTTIRTVQRVAVDTCLVNRLTLEEVVVTLTHRMTDGVECRVVHHELYSVEVTLAVDRGIVAVRTLFVEGLGQTVPLVGPYIRQLVRADRHYCIN